MANFNIRNTSKAADPCRHHTEHDFWYVQRFAFGIAILSALLTKKFVILKVDSTMHFCIFGP